MNGPGGFGLVVSGFGWNGWAKAKKFEKHKKNIRRMRSQDKSRSGSSWESFPKGNRIPSGQIPAFTARHVKAGLGTTKRGMQKASLEHVFPH